LRRRVFELGELRAQLNSFDKESEQRKGERLAGSEVTFFIEAGTES